MSLPERTTVATGAVPLGSARLEEIAELIGEEAALALSIHFGGRDVYVPSDPQPRSPLVLTIGLENVRRLAKRYRSRPLAVPINAGKRARIVALRKGGLTVSAISRSIGCTERHVYAVVADFEASGGSLGRGDRQLQLFDPDGES